MSNNEAQNSSATVNDLEVDQVDNLSSENNQKIEKLQSINLKLTTLVEVGSELLLEDNIEQLMHIVCKGGRQLLDACYAGMMVENIDNVREFKTVLITKNNERTLTIRKPPMLQGLLKEVFVGEKSICSQSPVLDLVVLGLQDVSMPISSFLSAPIKTSRARYGQLYFINKESKSNFDANDQRFIMMLADKFAIHYENRILIQALERNKKRLEEEIDRKIQTGNALRHSVKDFHQWADLGRVNSMSEIADALAHELNQPLTAILTYNQTCVRKLINEKLQSTEIFKGLEMIAQQAVRAGNIVHRIKDFVRKGVLLLEDLNINDVLLDIEPLLQYEIQNTSIVIKFELCEFPPTIYFDKIQIEQVIINLSRNAIEAMIEADTFKPLLIIQTSINQNNILDLSFIDNGPGFSPSISALLFNPYFTTKKSGTGMGLAISHTIIKAHGGEISASRELDKTCFHVSLPINPRGFL